MIKTHVRAGGAGAVSVDGPNFEQLLDQFKGDLSFEKLLEKIEVSPDEHLYKIETNDGNYYVLEIDFIEDFKYLADLVNREIGGFKHFIEVKVPPTTLEETSPYKISSTYQKPKDFDYFKKYMNDKYGSFEGYFNFLVKV